MDDIIQGVTEGPNVVGSTPSVKPPALEPLPASPYDDFIPAQVPTIEQRAVAQREVDTNTPGFVDTVKESAEADWALSWSLMEQGDHAPDPNWEPSKEELKYFTDTVPEDWWSLANRAQSAAHLETLRKIALEDAKREQRLANTGLSGLGVRVLTNIFDPVALGATVASEGALAPILGAMKVGRIGRILWTGLAAGTSNVAIDAVSPNPKIGADDMAVSFAAGMMLGGLYGGLRRNPNIQPEIDEIISQSSRVIRRSQQAPPGSVGAAAVGDKRPSLINDEPIMDDAPMGSYGAVRFDSAGQLSTSTNSGTARRMGPLLGEDAVGLKGHETVPYSASEWAGRMFRTANADWKRTMMPEWDAWAQEQGLSWWKRKANPGREFERFMDDIHSYMEDANPITNGGHNQHVVKAGEKARAIFKSWAELLQNPGLDEGKLYRPVSGFGNLAPDKFYVPKYSDHEKINTLYDTFSATTLRNFVRAAVQSAMEDAEEKLVNRIADGWLKNITGARVGIADTFDAAFGSGDKAAMRTALQSMEIDDEAIEKIVGRFGRSDTGDSSRAMRRTPLDYNFSVGVRANDGSIKNLRIRDFFVTDTDAIVQRYSREAAGRVALAKIKLKDDTGATFMDGITSDADFEKIKTFVKNEHQMSGSKDSAALKRDIDNLDALYSSVLARPVHDGSSLVTAMRRVKDYNFIRLMNRMGLAQSMEVSKVVTKLGIKAALTHMPSLRRIIQGGESVPVNQLAREIEFNTGEATDAFFGSMRYRYNEEVVGEQIGRTRLQRAGRKVDAYLQQGKRITSSISLMNQVNTRLQQMAAKGVAQRLYNIARKGGEGALKGKDAERLRLIGLSEADASEVFTALRQFGERSGGKLISLHTDQWPAATRAKFWNALTRFSHQIVQQNDFGNLHRFMAKPGVQLMTQFRSFIIGAWAKNTLAGAHHLDMRQFTTWAFEIVMGSATYALQVHATALARSDADEYRAKELSIGNLALKGVARTGFASLMPAITDSISGLTTGHPIFDARTSATSSDLFFGAPAFGMYKDTESFLKGAIGSVREGRQMSQRELLSGLRVAPHGNWFPIMWLFNGLIGDRPYMEPRER